LVKIARKQRGLGPRLRLGPLPEALELYKNMMEKQFNRARISAKDFEEAASYLAAYENDLAEPIMRSLLTSAVIAYARPFTDNQASPNATNMVAGNPKVILGNSGYKLHELVLEYRHQAIAHSSYEKNPTRATEYRKTGFAISSRFFDILSQGIEVNKFNVIADKMQKHCENKMFELSRAISSNN
jgi:hypothetical protein